MPFERDDGQILPRAGFMTEQKLAEIRAASEHQQREDALTAAFITLAAIVVGVIVLWILWSKRHRIFAAAADAAVDATAAAVKGARKFWQRVEDRAAKWWCFGGWRHRFGFPRRPRHLRGA